MRTAIEHRGPGIVLVIDTTDAATPAMVYCRRSDNYSATFDCACGTGLLSGRDGDTELNAEQLAWLAKFDDLVADAYNVARKDHPDYA